MALLPKMNKNWRIIDVYTDIAGTDKLWATGLQGRLFANLAKPFI
jgi:hypothetical protein